MKIIGITGGVGSGKSRILSFLEEHYEASAYRADDVARTLQKKGQNCYENIVSYFGTAILNPDQTIDRSKLAEIVFSDKAALAALNSIVHPEVKSYLIREIKKERLRKRAFFFIEAALLLEDKYDKICDELWYIYVETDARRERLIKQRAYSEEKISALCANQLSECEFRRRCDRTIDNSGPFVETEKQIQKFMAELGASEVEK